LVLVVREDAGNHVEARRAWQTVLRSLQRAEATGLRISLLGSIHPVLLRSQSGLLLGRRAGYGVDLDRLNRVVTRIVKGLFFHEKGYRLPATHEAVGLVDPKLNQEEQSLAYLTKVLGPLQFQPETRVGDGIFSYRFLFTTDEPDSSVWLMSFYEKLHAIGVTLPLSALQPD
jgi:hypothetical protein